MSELPDGDGDTHPGVGRVWIAHHGGHVANYGSTLRHFDAQYGRSAWMPYCDGDPCPPHPGPDPFPEPSCYVGPDRAPYWGDILPEPDVFHEDEVHYGPLRDLLHDAPTEDTEPDSGPWIVRPWQADGTTWQWAVAQVVDGGAPPFARCNLQADAIKVRDTLNAKPPIPAEVRAVVDAAKVERACELDKTRDLGAAQIARRRAVDDLIAKEATT
jgi:hypothetical protein